jgi:hypothetical protein
MRTVRRRIYAAHLTVCRGIIEQLEQVEIDAFPTAFVTGWFLRTRTGVDEVPRSLNAPGASRGVFPPGCTRHSWCSWIPEQMGEEWRTCPRETREQVLEVSKSSCPGAWRLEAFWLDGSRMWGLAGWTVGPLDHWNGRDAGCYLYFSILREMSAYSTVRCQQTSLPPIALQ